MPAVDTGGAKTGGPRRRARPPAPAPKRQPSPPRQADQGDPARRAPEPDTGKQVMFAHPGRRHPQQAMREQQNRLDLEAEKKQKRLEREARADKRRKRAIRNVRVTPVQSPDASDSTRSPSQQAHDRASRDTAVRESRLKVLRARHRGAGTRLVKHLVTGRGGPAGPISESDATPTRRVIDSTAQGSLLSIGVPPTIRRVVEAVGLGIAKDPKTALPQTAKGLRDMATGAPAAIVKTIVDPKGTAKSVGADYKRRYGGINSPHGVDKMADRISKEGAAPELVDAVSVGVPVAKTIDLGLGASARAGALGSKLERAATKVRPKIRTSGGRVHVQPKSKGLVGALRQNRRDTLARKAVVRTAEKADEAARATARDAVEGADHGIPLTDLRRPRGEIDAVVREAYNRGEVVPTRVARPGRRAVSGRKLRKAQGHDVNLEQGRSLHAQRTEQRTEISRGANKVLAGLNPREQRAFKLAMQSGALTPAAGREAALSRIALIEKTRRYGDDTLNSSVDELPTLHRIADNPAAHFTPRLERAVRTEMERGARVGEGDPSLGSTATERAQTAEARRLAPEAELRGIRRAGTPVDEAIKRGDEKVAAARKRKDKALAKRDAAARRLSGVEGYARAGADVAKRAIDHQIARQEHIVTVHGETAARMDARAARARYPHTRAEWTAKAKKARIREGVATKKLERLKGNREAARIDYRRAVQKARAARADAQHELERQLNGLRAMGDAARSVRRQKAKGAKLIGAEPMGDFHRHVRTARGEANTRLNGGGVGPRHFGEPGYYPSVPKERRRFSPFTIGGARKVKGSRAYTGKLYRAGREENSITTYTSALAQNVKRKHNWKFVADTIQAHALPWSRPEVNGKVAGLKYGEIDRAMAKHGIDPDSVVIMDMDAFDKRAAALGDSAGDRIIGDPRRIGPARRVSEAESELYAATRDSMMTGRAAVDRAAELEPGAGRLVVFPKAVGDELLTSVKPSGALGRGLDVVKGKLARIMLGLSPAWLQFQVGANVIQTLLGTKSLPHEWVYANLKWWHELSPEQRTALEPIIGIGSFHDAIETPRMGASAQGGLVNSWRAMKAHPFWHKPRGKAMRGASVSQLNPLDTLFRLDNLENNFFRRAVLYNNLRRQAYDRMGKSMLDGQRAIDKVMGTASKDVRGTMDALINDKVALEQAAVAVKDFLGDYQTYSARERRILGRNIMFYGYLRWSLRFTFYTMPIKHPVMTSIIAQLGGLNAREVQKLLGGDELPWALGKLYFTKDGKLKEVDVSRANPFLNAVTQAKIPEKGAVRGALLSALGFLPPIYTAALDVAYSKTSFKDRPVKVDSESTTRPNKAGQAITDVQALEIYAKEIAELAAPIRLLSRVRADGRPVSDNSLPFLHERYTTYKDRKIRLDVQKAREDLTTGERVRNELLPFWPRPSRDPETAGKIRRARGKGSGTVSTQPIDPETQKLIDYYRSNPPETSAPSASELQTLIDTYGG